MEVKNVIGKNLRQHEPYDAINYDELINFPDIDESDVENKSSDFKIVNPDLKEFNVVSNKDSNNIAISSALVEVKLLPTEQFYYRFSQLNGVQDNFCSFIMTHVMKCITAFKSNEGKPGPFYVHLTGGARMGKSFLMDVIIEYVKINVKYYGQKLEQSTNVVTAITVKAASHLNGLTLITLSFSFTNKWKQEE